MVRLRAVREEDLDVLFAHQSDPEAARLAGFPARDRAAFTTHWRRIMADPTVATYAVDVDGEVAGNAVAWWDGGHREIGYWIGRDRWGRGVATRAVALLTALEPERPLLAFVAEHNAPSVRVLEKNGFVRTPERDLVERGLRYVALTLA